MPFDWADIHLISEGVCVHPQKIPWTTFFSCSEDDENKVDLSLNLVSRFFLFPR